MARQTVVYDDFSGGEWGSLNEYKRAKNMWTGSNVLVNRAGELHCRPGLINRTPSGVAAGVVHGFGCHGVPGKDAWYIQGTTVRIFSILGGNNLGNASGALASTPTSPVDVATDTNTSFFASEADKVYRVDSVANSVAGLTGSPGAFVIGGYYGDRIVVGDINGSNAYRLRWSDGPDAAGLKQPNSWTSTNIVDIGDNWGIKGLYAQRQHLLIAKQTGYHILTGVPGENSVIRAQQNYPGPYHGLHSAMGPDDLVALIPGDNKYPAFHNGASLRQFTYLDNHLTAARDSSTFPATHGVAQSNGFTRAFYFFQTSENKNITWLNNVWSYHTFGVNISGFVSKQGHGQYAYICDGGGAATAPKFYIWNPAADTPGIVGGDNMMPGDDSTSLLTANVSFPEWSTEDGDEVLVRSVIVDFRTWNTGAANTNHFDLHVEAKNLYDTTSTRASNTVSFDQAQASSSSSGTEQRRIFGFGEQGVGSGFQLHLTNMRGIAIKRITVVLDRAPTRAF